MTTHEKRTSTPQKKSHETGLGSTKGTRGPHKDKKHLPLSKLRHKGKHR